MSNLLSNFTNSGPVSGGGGGGGTVTSVGLSSDSGSVTPITASGTFAIVGADGVSTSASGSTLTISGGGSRSIATKTGNYSVTASDGFILIDHSGSSGDITLTLPAPASVLFGNDLKASDGTTAITLTDSTGAVATAGAVSAGGDVTLASGKDLVLQGGGYVKAGASGVLFKNSSDTTILSSSGGDIAVSANLGVTGDLTVTGNDIKDSSAATALSFSSGAVTTGGNFTVGSSGTTTFNGIAYTWPAADASSSGYVLKSNSLGTLSWGADDAGGITTSRQTGTSFSAAAG